MNIISAFIVALEEKMNFFKMNIIISLIVSIITTLSIIFIVGNFNNNKEIKFENNGNFYFPKEIGIDAFVNDWYSKQLTALEEPIIYINENVTDKTIYRFTCLRTFHQPFSIRIEIEEKNQSAKLYFKMADGTGGYEPGQLIINEEINLNAKAIENINQIMKKNNYWKMSFKDNNLGFDGSEWIIEMFKDNKYHAITRWTPEKGAVYDLGKLLINLSEQKIDELY